MGFQALQHGFPFRRCRGRRGSPWRFRPMTPLGRPSGRLARGLFQSRGRGSRNGVPAVGMETTWNLGALSSIGWSWPGRPPLEWRGGPVHFHNLVIICRARLHKILESPS
ncbi:hypothetical protein GQ53DRAFT_747850 [Thozetella sp. PMI_491]|nr:hypothetical protein GQ53DRAFT_747850 [Thozetella sp. PMI_491]